MYFRVVVYDAEDHESADVRADLHKCAEDDEELERALLDARAGLASILQSCTGSQDRQNYRGSLYRNCEEVVEGLSIIGFELKWVEILFYIRADVEQCQTHNRQNDQSQWYKDHWLGNHPPKAGWIKLGRGFSYSVNWVPDDETRKYNHYHCCGQIKPYFPVELAINQDWRVEVLVAEGQSHVNFNGLAS